MKRNQLLHFIIITFSICLSHHTKAQSIDSCVVLGLSSPPIVHVYSSFPHDGYEFTHFEIDYISGNDILNLFFKECTGNNITTLFDTIHTPLSSFNVVPDTIIVNLILDTNTVDLNCIINTTQTTTDVLIIDVASLEVTEKPFDYFTIYPNPVTSKLHLNNLPHSKVKSIILFTSSGKIAKTYSSTSTCLDVDELITGYYILEVTTVNTIIRKKVIIK
jgi:hypothetical protein